MDNNNSNIDFNEMLKLVKSISKPAPENPSTLSGVDKLVNHQDLRIMKAALPYLNPSSKKNIAVIIKLLELKRTMDIFSINDELTLSELYKTPSSNLDILKEFRDCCDGQNKNRLNMLVNIMNIKNILETYNAQPSILGSQEMNVNENSSKPKETSTVKDNNFNEVINMLNKIIDEKEMDGE